MNVLDGKSYQAKHKKGVENFIKTQKENAVKECIDRYLKGGERFFLICRFLEQIKGNFVEQYFQDVDVASLTENRSNCITQYRKALYFSNYDVETGKTTRQEKIGYISALAVEHNLVGASYLDVTNIIFEEFMSRTYYLKDEPTKLMNFYCTVDRKRGTTRLWLLGNSITRVCPYIQEWGLHKLFSKMKQGDIEELYIDSFKDEETGKIQKIKLAIEYCRSTGRSSYTIGFNKDMMNNGSWQTFPQPHLPKSIKYYKILYRIAFQYQGFTFLAEYLKDNETKEKCWFVYPRNRDDFFGKIIIFSDKIKPEKNWQRNIYDITIKNTRLQNLLNTFRETNIFYSDDLCGTDFKQCIDFKIKL